MSTVLRTTTVLLLVHIAHSYILLTANIEDVQNVAKRLIQYPIGGQMGTIMRRAYNVFSNQLDNARRRGDLDSNLGFSPDERRKDKDSRRHRDRRDSDNDRDNITREKDTTRENEVDGTDRQSQSHEGPGEKFGSLGKSASVYLQKIKNIFDNA